MIWWLLSVAAVYLLGYVLAFRRIAGQLAWHFCAVSQRTVPDGAQWFGAVVSALLLAAVWPASLPVAYGIASSRTGEKFALYTPPSVRERLLATRIKELERKAGIR